MEERKKASAFLLTMGLGFYRCSISILLALSWAVILGLAALIYVAESVVTVAESVVTTSERDTISLVFLTKVSMRL